MPAKLATTISKIDLISNRKNSDLVKKFCDFMRSNGASERHQNNNLKSIIAFANFLGEKTSFTEINKSEQILSFLNTKMRSQQDDPEKKWITTWNDYLHRIKHFLRWLHNIETVRTEVPLPMDDWITPTFLKIKEKRTKRISPYLETELWEKEDILLITKYEIYKRNKAILTLLWDLDARNHEITLLKIKHIRLREKYGEGEIPQEAKTGTGPVLLTCSLPYVRDWLNEHPFRNELEARLICNLHNGSPVKPESIWTMMKQLRERIIRLLERGEIQNVDERERLHYLIKSKRWNPYCIRHSAITSDSDFLPEYALKKKVRWSMNSKQPSRYIKRRMGNDLKQKILFHNGIISEDEFKIKPSASNCPRCSFINTIENKYCSKCFYPMNQSVFEEIKQIEGRRIDEIMEKFDKEIKNLHIKFDQNISEILSVIQKDPRLTQIKIAVLKKKLGFVN